MSVISIDGRTKVYCGNDAPEENHVENVEDRIDGKDDASKEEKTVKCNGNIAIRCNGQNCEVLDVAMEERSILTSTSSTIQQFKPTYK